MKFLRSISIGTIATLAAGLLIGVVPSQAGAAAVPSLVSPASGSASETGRKYDWGKTINDAGNAFTNRRLPEPWVDPVDPNTPWSKAFISIGTDQNTGLMCGIDSAEKLWCRSSNGVPEAVAPDMNWLKVSPGSSHICAITTDYELFCWGDNSVGQLGIGTLTDSDTPQKVNSSYTFKDLESGGGFTCAITQSEGYVLCWGAGSDGRLGNNTYTNKQKTPTQIHNPAQVNQNWDKEFIEVTAGGNHACGIDIDGYGYCWGAGFDGELGIGQTGFSVVRKVPTRILAANGNHWSAELISISAGRDHTCAVRVNNDTYCWGKDTYGSLGNGNNSKNKEKPNPVKVKNRQFLSVSAGWAHTCGVEAATFRAWCWGQNMFGTLGDNSTGWKAVPSRVHDPSNPSSNWAAKWHSIEVGYDVTVGVRLATEQTITFPTPSDTPLSGGPLSLNGSATSGLTVTYTSNTTDVCEVSGATVVLNAPGVCEIVASQSGDADYWPAANVTVSFNVTKGEQKIQFPNPGSKNSADFADGGMALSAASNADLAVTFTSQTTAVCQVSGILVTKHGTGDCTITAVQPGDSDYNAATPVIQTFTISDGPASESVWQWGAFSSNADKTPTPLSSSLVFTSVHAGRSYACGITDDKRAYCWGEGDDGKLGSGFENQSGARPVQVLGSYETGQYEWASISPGGSHTCGVTISGRGLCWGKNGHGQLGDGTTTSSKIPVPVSDPMPGNGGTAWRAIDTGTTYTCGVTVDNKAYCWGNNFYGNHGNGSTSGLHDAISVPQEVDGGDWQSIEVSGGGYACGVKTNGAAFCWGTGSNGILGNGTQTSKQKTPTPVLGGHEFSSLSVDDHHACGLTTDDFLYCWGSNLFGQVGNGLIMGGGGTTGGHQSSAIELLPTQVGSDTWAAALTGYNLFSCGIKTNNKSFCWGRVTGGQLGNGQTDNVGTSVPVQVTTNQGFSMGESGYNFTVAIRSRQDQVITFEPIPEHVVTTGWANLFATSDAGTPVSFTTANENVCRFTGGNQVELVSVGECVVIANAAETDNHRAAPTVQQVFNVIKDVGHLDLDGVAETLVTGGLVDVLASSHAGADVSFAVADESVCKVTTDNMLKPMGVGTCVVTGTATATPTHSGATAQHTFNVIKDVGHLVLDGVAETLITGGLVDVLASSHAGADVSFAVADESVCKVTTDNMLKPMGVGTCVVTGTATATSTHSGATAQHTFNVIKDEQTITFPPIAEQVVTAGSVVLGATSDAPEATVTYLSKTPGVCQIIDDNKVQLLTTGKCKITANAAETSHHNEAQPETQTFNISQLAAPNPPPAPNPPSAPNPPASSDGAPGPDQVEPPSDVPVPETEQAPVTTKPNLGPPGPVVRLKGQRKSRNKSDRFFMKFLEPRFDGGSPITNYNWRIKITGKPARMSGDARGWTKWNSMNVEKGQKKMRQKLDRFKFLSELPDGTRIHIQVHSENAIGTSRNRKASVVHGLATLPANG